MKHLLLTTIAAVVLVGCGLSEADRALLDAAENGNIEDVKQHLAAGADVNAKDDAFSGETPLHWAAENGHKEIAELLIAKGADVNAKSDGNWTPLHDAAKYGRKETIELLIAKGADVNANSDDYGTPLDWAINGRQAETINLLRKHGGKTGEELKGGEPVVEAAKPEPPTAKAPAISIHEAAKAGNIETVKQHLAAGTDVNAESRDKYRGTPLHFAALGGHKELIELLIVKGADVNANSNGGTPLHIAVGSGHKEAVELLIAKGAGVNAKEGFTGSTPLNEATGEGHNQVIELLIAKGADVNAKNGLGFTPLDMATIPDTRFDTTETADLIRKHGGKHSSIHEAAAGGDAEGVKEFLAAGTLTRRRYHP
ncbi:ankyrin repeat domain-containing protein [bacterium]|nr:ankyrin repeat domain-containing protein [bacterium]